MKSARIVKPKESLEVVLEKIPNFQELAKSYMDNLKHSYDKVMDDLIEEKKHLYRKMDKENLSGDERREIMQEIKSIRKMIIIKDALYNIQNNKVFEIGVIALTVIVGAIALQQRDKD